MGRWADSNLAEVRHNWVKLDLVEVAGRYTTLHQSGDLYCGLCPIHGDTSPSFFVYPENQSFFCFGCRAHGDAIALVMQVEHVDFATAVSKAAVNGHAELSLWESQRPANEEAALLLLAKVARTRWRELPLNSWDEFHQRLGIARQQIQESVDPLTPAIEFVRTV